MTLLDINFTSYIPTTLLGLLGLISGYLFFYFRNKNDNKLKEIQSTNPKDRIKAIEMSLNELGVTIDTSSMGSKEKLILIKEILRTKTNRYLIISLTLIIITLFVTFLIWNNKNNNTDNNDNNNVDTTKTIDTTKIKNTNQIKPIIDTTQTNIVKDIQETLDTLTSLTTYDQISKSRKERYDDSSTQYITRVSIYANVTFQYSDGKTYYTIINYNDLKNDFYYHLEITLFDKNNNIIKVFKTESYKMKGIEDKRIEERLSYDLPSIEKIERLKVKRVYAKLYFD